MTLNADRTRLEVSAPIPDCDGADAVPTAPPARHPLGPPVRIVPLASPVLGRLYAAGVAAAAGALLVVAATLAPHGRHMGTHQELGLPPCGFVMVTGLPCPTCGMTTAFAYAVRGRFVEAVRSQPAGFLLAVATAGVGVAGLLAVVTGRRPAVNWYRVDPTRLVWWTTGLLVACWAVKILFGLMDGSLPVS